MTIEGMWSQLRPNYAFKPTAEHVLPLSCRAWRGGGLTRALGGNSSVTVNM